MIPISGQSITLANSIIGVGILAMPFCFKECGIVLAIIILIISGIISRLSCYFLLKSALLCRRRNFESLAFQVFGPTGKFAVEIGIIGFLLGTCIAYFVVVGDLGPQIIAKMFNLNHSDTLRTFVMVCVSIVCVLPLGLLKNVDSLSNLCAATICFYICLVFKVMSEATPAIASFNWVNQVEYWRTDGVLQCMPIFSMALFCQTQLFEIYESLPNPSLDKMDVVTKSAINICTTVYILVGFFGYIAFYTKPITGNILVSFSPTLASDAVKMGFVMSLAFSFPLIIFPCRASLYSLLYRKGQSNYHEVMSNLIPETRFRWITILIITASLTIGLLIPNIELVLGLVGSTIGVMISVIIPATCFICLTNKYTNNRMLAQVVLSAGVIIMVLGTYANLQAADRHETYIEMYATPKIIKISHDDEKSRILDNVDVKEGLVKNEESLFHNPIVVEDRKHIKVENEIIKESKVQPPVPVEPREEPNPEIIKESMVQPPVPVAPIEIKDKERKSNFERENANKNEIVTENAKQSKLEYIPLNEKSKDEVSQVEESPNMINDDKLSLKEDLLHDKIIKDEKTLVDKAKELQQMSDVVKNDEAIESLKKVALIEQIKQHGKEQRELVEEQKEILKEIKKTKMEIDEEKLKANKSKHNDENKDVKIDNIKAVNSVSNEGKHDIKNKKILEADQDNREELVENKLPKVSNTLLKDVRDAVQVPQEIIQHIHKADEPKSYRLGEDLGPEFNNVNVAPSNKEAMVKNIPIPIAVALQRNNYSKEELDNNIIRNANEIKENQIANNPEDLPLVIKNEVNHLGGKRDILDVKENEKNVHSINKRSVEGISRESDLIKEECDKDRNNILHDKLKDIISVKRELNKGVVGNVNLAVIDLGSVIVSRNLKSIDEDINTG